MGESEKIGMRGFVRKIERATVVRAIRGDLIIIIPVLIIGAFSLILKTFPVEGYQKFIENFAGGFFLSLFDLVYSATFGVLSLYMTFAISHSYMKIKADPDTVHGAAVATSTLSFFILAGANLENFSKDSMGPKSMFLAIIAGLGASAAYYHLHRFIRKKSKAVLSSGADRDFNRVLSTLFPIAIVAVSTAIINTAVTRLFDAESFRMLLSNLFDKLFSYGETGFLKGFFFVLLSSVLWFFGIHGSDTLEGVMQTYFAPGLAANQAAVAANAAPTTVLTKEFFDCFVLMGGCGATICLLISILIFSRNRAKRGLGVTAAFPMIFNINEMMVFGLPIIFNPIMLIPFLLTPLVCYSVSYLAISTGLVPMITSSVEWTTPIILGGFRTTGSAAGAMLQVVNVALGVLIYMPFVKLLDRRTEEETKHNFSSFIDYFRKNEAALAARKLTDLPDINGDIAKGIAAELRHAATVQNITLAYQPQFDYNGVCTGVEALLRYSHPTQGIVYPPLVIKLAEDGGFLPTLEEAIVRQVIADRPAVLSKFGNDIQISFNVTGTTVVTDRFISFIRQLDAKDPFRGKNICVEVTEQAALAFDSRTREAFDALHAMGLSLAIDDFSMGQTSLNYLKENMFDEIKLDGSLVRGLSTNQNCREIVSSIVSLSITLNMKVVAEFVETEGQRDTLREIGCGCYQGYLYSPAVFLTDK